MTIRIVVPALILLGAIAFILSGVEKFFDRATFTRALFNHGLLPARFVPAMTSLVPTTEVVIGAAALWFVADRRTVTRAAALLCIWSLTLTAYAASMMVGPPPKKAGCGCGMLALPTEDWSVHTAEVSGFTLAYGLIAVGVRGGRSGANSQDRRA